MTVCKGWEGAQSASEVGLSALHTIVKYLYFQIG